MTPTLATAFAALPQDGAGALALPVRGARFALGRPGGETVRGVVQPHEVTFTAIRAQGAGGQNVNKVSSAIHLRFDIAQSSLPDDIKQRLLALGDQRITDAGVVVIKAQTTRSQEQNRADAQALANMLWAVYQCPVPIIGRLQGDCKALSTAWPPRPKLAKPPDPAPAPSENGWKAKSHGGM